MIQIQRRVHGVRLRSAPHKLRHFALIHTAVGVAPGEVPVYAQKSDLTAPLGNTRGGTSDQAVHYDQGDDGSCGGHAISTWAELCAKLARLRFSFDGRPSPRGILSSTLRIEQPGTAPLIDTGIEPADPILAISRIGLRAMDTRRTPDGRYSDIWSANDWSEPVPPPNFGLRPTAAEDIASAKNLLFGAQTIDPSDPMFAKLVAAGLTLNKPFAATMFVDSAFMNHGAAKDPTPLKGAPDFTDKRGGGHYVVIPAHKVEADGSISFLCWNSWSDDWGVPSEGVPDVGGNIWLSEERFTSSCTETFAGAITIRGATALPLAA